MAGVSDKSVQRYKKVLQDADADVVAKVDTGQISINEGYKQVKQAEHKEKVRKQIEEIEQQAIEKTDGLFDVIVIDPPVFLRLSIMGSLETTPQNKSFWQVKGAILRRLDLSFVDMFTSAFHFVKR